MFEDIYQQKIVNTALFQLLRCVDLIFYLFHMIVSWIFGGFELQVKPKKGFEGVNFGCGNL